MLLNKKNNEKATDDENNTNELFKNAAGKFLNKSTLSSSLLGLNHEANQDDIKLKVFNAIVQFKNMLKKRCNQFRVKYKNNLERKNEGLNMYMDYYNSLYVTKSADHEKLLELLKLYDSPDFKSPYPPHSAEYELFNPCGFIAAEIEAILSFVFLQKENRDFFIRDESENLEILDNEQQLLNYKRYYEQAIISYAYILFYGNNFECLKKNVHSDNIEMSIIETITSIDFSILPFTKTQFIEAISKKGLINKNNITIISRKRKVN